MTKVDLSNLFITGKHPQRKKSLTANPNSKQYEPKVAASRKKEKARRAHNARIRRMRGK